MRRSLALQTHREAIRTVALSHRATKVRVFGSVLTGDETDDSDLVPKKQIEQEVTQQQFATTPGCLSQSQVGSSSHFSQQNSSAGIEADR